jgi:Transcriptional regulators
MKKASAAMEERAARPRSPSDTSVEVVTALRHRIHNCAVMPGERLKFDELRAHYGASVGTLREALATLESEGLVRGERNRGFVVAPVSVEDLLDITDLRVDIEKKALRLSLAHGDDAWEAALVSAWHMLSIVQESRASASEFDSTWAQRHEHFHACLVAACPSTWTLRFRSLLFGLYHRYLCLATKIRATTGVRGFGEHEQLLKLAIARDVEQIGSVMEHHIRSTTKSILSGLPELQSQGLAVSTTKSGR